MSMIVMSAYYRPLGSIGMWRGQLIYHGNLDSVRDYTDARDVAKAYMAAMEHCNPGEPYNICSNMRITIGDLLQLFVDLSTHPGGIETKVDPERFLELRTHKSRYFVSSNYQLKQRWRVVAREWITKYAGNKCCICGYDRYIGNLIFHHVDPKTKSAEVSTLIKNTQGWTTILSEVEKCILVCHRCHGEIHAGLVESPEIDCNQRDEIYREILEDQPIPNSRKFKYCQQCGKRMKGNKYCSRKCVAKSQERIIWPPNLEELVTNSSKRAVAQKLGVSDKAVAKRLK